MNTSKLKILNKNKIRDALREKKISSKNELSDITKLSVATCGNILRDLCKEGEVTEVEFKPSTGGRPSKQFKYNFDYAYVLSIYVRKENQEESLYYQVKNLNGETIESSFAWIDHLRISTIEEVIEKLLKENPQIKILSLGVPGVVNEGVVGICDIASLSNYDIANHLTNRFSIEVLIENDVNLTALGKFEELSEADESFVYLYYPLKGMPGAGVIVNGVPVKGQTNFAGEVSFLPNENRQTEFDMDQSLTRVINTLLAFICILNPGKIVLSGLDFSEGDLEKLYLGLTSIISEEHMPDLDIEEDIHNSYANGLFKMAMKAYRRSEK